jgi:hypothetical protein
VHRSVRPTVLGFLLAVALAGAPDRAAAAAGDPPSPAAEASPGDREKSRAAFRRGVAQLRAQDWAGARASFEEAWSLVQHPSILLNLGIARLRTDDPVLAEQDLVRFLTDDTGASQEELASARDALTEARTKIGTVRVIVMPQSAKVTVDGKAVATKPSALISEGSIAETRVKAGKHTVVVDAPGFSPDQHDVDVPGKGEAEHKVTLGSGGGEPQSSSRGATEAGKSRTRRIVGWSLAGVAGVGLITSGVLALEAASLSSDYGNPSSKSFQSPSVKSEGIGYRTGADVALLLALLAGTGSVLLLFTDVAGSRIARPGVIHW